MSAPKDAAMLPPSSKPPSGMFGRCEEEDSPNGVIACLMGEGGLDVRVALGDGGGGNAGTVIVPHP